jgi:FkbH-like protein
LQEANFFETTTVSDEDRRRVEMYGEENRRAETAARAASMDEYLEYLEMIARFTPLDAFSIPRAAQLTQRSNQFNLRTKRYAEQDLQRFARDASRIVRCLSLTDRFGDYGLVGVVVLTREADGRSLFLDTLLMSCRVLKRGVEAFLFNALVALAKAEGAEFLTGEYLPTAKNGMVAHLLEDFGFRREEALREGAASPHASPEPHASPPPKGGVRLRLALSDYVERRTHVRESE